MIHERQAQQAEPLTAATRGEGPACCLADTWVTPPTTPLPPALENSPVCLHLDPAAQLGLGPSHGWMGSELGAWRQCGRGTVTEGPCPSPRAALLRRGCGRARSMANPRGSQGQGDSSRWAGEMRSERWVWKGQRVKKDRKEPAGYGTCSPRVTKTPKGDGLTWSLRQQDEDQKGRRLGGQEEERRMQVGCQESVLGLPCWHCG